MLIDARRVPEGEEVKCDLCILGGGAAGITIANELHSTGLDIVVLESGGLEFDDQDQALYQAADFDEPYPDPLWSRLRYWGGATNHWEGNCSPLSDIDFEERSFVPHSGWPFDRAKLQTYYDRAKRYCQLGTGSFDQQDWSDRSEVSSLDLSRSKLRTGLSRYSPPTLFGQVWGPHLIEGSAVRVFHKANVTNVEFDERTTEVRRVEVRSATGSSFFVKSGVFVMCLGGIENARLLRFWNYGNDNRLGNQCDSVGRYYMDHPVVEAAVLLPIPTQETFAFYQPHEVDSGEITGFLELSKETLLENNLTNIRMPLIPASTYFLSDGVSSYHILKEKEKLLERFGETWRHLRNVLLDLDMVVEAMGRKRKGKRTFEKSDDFAGFLMDIMMEQLPNRENRIALSKNVDAFGVPKVDVQWQLSQAEIDNTWKALDVVAREVGRLGLGRLRILKDRSARIWGSQLSFGNHHMGSTRIWKDPEHGVVNENLRVHGTQNLFVAGSSVFPTGGHVPPTLTVVALSIRLADHIKEGWR